MLRTVLLFAARPGLRARTADAGSPSRNTDGELRRNPMACAIAIVDLHFRYRTLSPALIQRGRHTAPPDRARWRAWLIDGTPAGCSEHPMFLFSASSSCATCCAGGSQGRIPSSQTFPITTTIHLGIHSNMQGGKVPSGPPRLLTAGHRPRDSRRPCPGSLPSCSGWSPGTAPGHGGRRVSVTPRGDNLDRNRATSRAPPWTCKASSG
jgi:hypothetical protein